MIWLIGLACKAKLTRFSVQKLKAQRSHFERETFGGRVPQGVRDAAPASWIIDAKVVLGSGVCTAGSRSPASNLASLQGTATIT